METNLFTPTEEQLRSLISRGVRLEGYSGLLRKDVTIIKLCDDNMRTRLGQLGVLRRAAIGCVALMYYCDESVYGNLLTEDSAGSDNVVVQFIGRASAYLQLIDMYRISIRPIGFTLFDLVQY